MRNTTLTGSWSGAYRYPHGRETVFNAQIDEVAGAFVGAIQEPNEFVPDNSSVLTAEIEGMRSASAVTFTKFYNHDAIRHAVRYEGSVDAKLTRVEGRWIIDQDGGSFFMTRDDTGAAEEAEQEAEANIEAPR